DPSSGRALLPLLEDPEDRVRILALHVIGETRYRPALSGIVKLVVDPDRPNAMEREALIDALGKFGREAEEALVRAGADRNPLGQRILGRIALEDVLVFIQGFSEDSDESPGWYEGQFDGLKARGRSAVFALMLIVETYFTPEPAFLKNRKAVQIRWHAVFGLGEFGDPVALPLLRRVVREAREAVRDKPEGAVESGGFDGERTAIVACWKIGDREPLLESVEKIRREIEDARKGRGRGRMDGETARRIATLYWDLAILLSPLNQVEEVVDAYRKNIWWNKEAGRRPADVSVAQYNIACAYAKDDQARKALDEYVKAVEMGYSEIKWSQKDGDLAPVHALPEFNFALAYAHLRKNADGELVDEARAESRRQALLQIRLGLERGASDASWFQQGKLQALEGEPDFHWCAARCFARAGAAEPCAAQLTRYAERARMRGEPPERLNEVAASEDFAKVKNHPAVRAALAAGGK
ncbi:MAG: hypothetical protein MUC63_08060, partial [Planctomycetes bacterium]|nr:hypothetical protein [Planctomycetota bacterium]